jgi:hypothetical protein
VRPLRQPQPADPSRPDLRFDELESLRHCPSISLHRVLLARTLNSMRDKAGHGP